ncbi:MAG: histone deacetylase [Peptococcia bacterium]|jgi:acetoin utilization deacetylase AcuC-like enzyme
MSKTGLIFFPAFDWAITPTHPEREERLLYTRDQIFEEGILDHREIVEYTPRLAEEKDIQRVHFCVPNVKEQTTTAHFISAGSALKLGDALMGGEINNGFSLVRPPGHHAMRVAHGNRGFCNINNEAILVEYLRKKYHLRKIAIVDTDVHHGDGTQDIFYHDPDVLFISMHQDGRTLYPGTGFVNELGGPGAYLKNINIPLPPGTTDEGFLKVWREIISPLLKDFAPELIINSAGQDNHFTDPLANMQVSSQGYAELTKELKPDLAVLEGGYAIETALPYVNLGILLALAGQDYSYVVEPQYRKQQVKQETRVTKYVDKLIAFWQNKFAQTPLSKEELFNGKMLYTNSRNLYYDTDNIREQQQEYVYYCPNCSGIYQVISQSDRAYGRNYCIKGISIPMYACSVCEEKAYEMWERDKKENMYDIYYLQDKKNDHYFME